MDWDMFQKSSGDDVSLLTEVVMDFIAKLIDDIVPMVTVKVFQTRNRGSMELFARL
ncbi:hypothetical protein JOB18_036728 [Solea senegalensis]|uniref:Uncharacterized protein n=1 Tax=Solea senegalensis TaxID=28829 RepID=A0AAV6Q026_SOLSE|nr:hypothetical protein JOB18_036728 [Solea senegalensis]